MRYHTRKHRVRDLLLYVAIASLIVAVIAAAAVHDARTGQPPIFSVKWLGFVGTTAIVFGYAIRGCRRSWRRRKFWWLLAAFFIAHLCVGVLVLTRVDGVALIYYAPLSGFEYALLTAYLGFFLDSK